MEEFTATHTLEKWRCRACEIRDSRLADEMRKPGVKYGVQFRWFPIGFQFDEPPRLSDG
jgi:hypothetical protein